MSLQPVSVEAKATAWDVFRIPTNASLSILYANCATHITFNINYSMAINMLYPYASTDHYATCLHNTTAIHLLFRRFIESQELALHSNLPPPSPPKKSQRRTKKWRKRCGIDSNNQLTLKMPSEIELNDRRSNLKISKIKFLRLRQICRFAIQITMTTRAVVAGCNCVDHAPSDYGNSIYNMPHMIRSTEPQHYNTWNQCTYFKTLQTAIHPNRNST